MLSLSVLFFCCIVSKSLDGFNNLNFSGWCFLVFCSIGLIWGVFAFVHFSCFVRGAYEITRQIQEIENVDYKALNFMTSYVIPLVSIDKPWVFIILSVTIAIMQIKADLFYANPIFTIFNFHTYKIKICHDSTKREFIAISRDSLEEGMYIKYIELNDNILYAKSMGRKNYDKPI